jgi:cell shape-determining protein MreC
MDNKTTREEPKYPNKPIDLSPDENTNELIARILDRDKQGLDQFKITMREKMLKNPRDCVFWLHNALEESIDFSRYIIEAIQSYQYLNEENKKLKLQIKELKENNKLMYEHP